MCVSKMRTSLVLSISLLKECGQWVTMTLLSENSCVRRGLVKISLHDLVKISYPGGSCTSKERIEGKSDKTDGRSTAPHLPVCRLQIGIPPPAHQLRTPTPISCDSAVGREHIGPLLLLFSANCPPYVW